MAIIKPEPGSPQWWVQRLSKKLNDRRKRYRVLEQYESGDHPLPEGDERARDMFKKFQRKARTNYCGLTVSSTRERLAITGFRSGGGGNPDVDREIWRIWQANHLDVDSNLVHDATLTYSDSYVLVSPNEDDPATPLITAEAPQQMIIEPDPVNRRIAAAALKMWHDEIEGVERAVLYLPATIHYFQRKPRSTSWLSTNEDWIAFDQLDEVPTAAPNPLGRVPVVRLVNRPKLRDGIVEGRAEFEDATDIQDRINLVVLDRLIVSKTQAYRQRWMLGVELEDDEGNPKDLPFVPGVDLLWALDDDPETVKFGEFTQVDLTPILKAAEDDIKAFVTVTGLPPHYVAGDLVNASADALAAAEARLVGRVRDHMTDFSDAWEQVLELAAQWAGIDLPADTEVIWADPERKTDAQLSDAGVKKMQFGVPWEQRMEDTGYSPQVIERMKTQRLDDAMHALVTAAPAPAPGQQPPGLAPAFQQPGAPVVTGGA